jgi:hypothetical protein
MDNTVLLYSSSEIGAPVLNNAAGATLSVLDVLVNGFRSLSVTSLVVASGVATATVAAHGYTGGAGRLVEISGASAAALNGKKRITPTGANTFTFAAAGVADGAVGGTIACKRPGLGYSWAARSGNVAILQRPADATTQALLRIDDSAAGTLAKIRSLDAYADLITYTGGTIEQYWYRGVNDATAKEWYLIATTRGFYLCQEHPGYPSSTQLAMASICGWGDAVADRAGDIWAAWTMGSIGIGRNSAVSTASASLLTANDLIWQRASHGIGGHVNANLMHSGDIGGALGYSANAPQWPGYTGALRLGADVPIREYRSDMQHPVRGSMPGLALTLVRMASDLHGRIVTVAQPGGAREYLCLGAICPGVGGTTALFWDLNGPWY